MASDLLFELGTEEIPSRMLARALAELPALVTARLAAARLTHGAVTALGTPRRLAVVVRGLAERQPDLDERVVGPPVGAAFAADGTVTKAGVGFAQKNGVDPATLTKAEVPGKKGLYVVATRHVAGQPAMAVLPGLLAELIAAIPWPKSMRWGWREVGFVRPLHWLVALYGGEVVPVRYGGLTAGRITHGHRFLAPAPIALASAADYVEALRPAFVIVDPAARRRMIEAELARLAAETGCTVRKDDDLLDEVTGLCEYPVGVWGGFDEAFLELPDEVLVTTMRNHQRYFALERNGRTANRFATIAATVVKDAAVVRQGNQRAIVPRLSDARFFFAEDCKKDLDALRAKLDDVVFQAKLGAAKSTGHKVKRIVGIVDALAERVGFERPDGAQIAHRAAELCKSDLLTGMVGELPELQGVMGMHYARRQLAADPATAGIADAVGTAIAEHYMPRGAGAALPTTIAGALVGIADRIDTLVGCFGTGLEPTGSADPYGLRRAANAILAIDLDLGPGGERHEPLGKGRGFPIKLDTLIEIAAHQFEGLIEVTDTDCGELHEFFRGRLRTLLIDGGLAAADVDAALGAGFDDPCDARLRAQALSVVPAAAREVFKRIANILDDAHGKGLAISGEVKPAMFVAPGNTEHRLWDAFTAVAPRLEAAQAAQAYRDMLGLLVELQPAVAAFFDKGGVMVMDPDAGLRENRLSLLHRILAPFAAIADFRLASQGTTAQGSAP